MPVLISTLLRFSVYATVLDRELKFVCPAVWAAKSSSVTALRTSCVHAAYVCIARALIMAMKKLGILAGDRHERETVLSRPT